MSIRDTLLRQKVSSAGAFANPGSLLWFVAAAVVAPFVLLTVGGSEANSLPWYFWAMVPLLLLVVIGVGFLRFTRTHQEAEDISISPRRHSNE